MLRDDLKKYNSKKSSDKVIRLIADLTKVLCTEKDDILGATSIIYLYIAYHKDLKSTKEDFVKLCSKHWDNWEPMA